MPTHEKQQTFDTHTGRQRHADRSRVAKTWGLLYC